ncbi:acyl carrier protein [Longispora sp. NPDC051575]|uniref:acyl carrier protein n=1 Tax=Longispora sp. NPDC051575 TaxID=3154943 RepID=UPI003423153F
MSLHDRLTGVFVEALELKSADGVDTLKYRDIDNWDSLGHMTLVAAIEDEFDVQFETEQVIDMSSFAVAVEMLRGLGVE